MSAEQVRGYLMERGIDYRTHTHERAYTTSEVAEAEHVPAEQVAKPVMLMADDRLVMAVVPGDRMVDLEKAREMLGATAIRLADEDEFAPSFADCEVGAEPPFGSLYGVATVVDAALVSPTITFNAGTHTETITMALDDYLAAASPQRGDLSS